MDGQARYRLMSDESPFFLLIQLCSIDPFALGHTFNLCSLTSQNCLMQTELIRNVLKKINNFTGLIRIGFDQLGFYTTYCY